MNQHYNKPALYYDIGEEDTPGEVGLSAAFKQQFPTVREALLFIRHGGVPVLRQKTSEEDSGSGFVYTPFTVENYAVYERQVAFVFKLSNATMKVIYDLPSSSEGGGGEGGGAG